MLRKFLLQLADEAVGSLILHRFLWHAGRPAAQHGGGGDDGRLRSGDASTFYGPVPEPLDLDRQWMRRLDGPEKAERSRFPGEVCDLRFPSPVASAFATNDLVWLRRWRRATPAPCAVLGLDGLVQLGSGWFDRLACLLQDDAVDVVMMDEPFNHRRTPRGYQPGQLILGGDLLHQLAVLRQGVLDAWMVVRSLQRAGYRVGVVGMSFGALLSLLLATTVPDLHFVVALVPPVDPITLLDEGGQVVRAMRRALAGLRLRDPQYADLLRPVRPLLRQPLLPADRIRLHVARHDRFVPSARIHQLAGHWQAPLEVHDEGHSSLYVSKAVARSVADNVRRLAPT